MSCAVNDHSHANRQRLSFSRVAAARRIPLFSLRRASMDMRTYYEYIMGSVSRTLYTGVTNNLERRVFEHKQGQPRSFTARYNVNRLVHFEEFGDINQAIDREKEIKRLTRRRKIKLIDSQNPDWCDLSLKWQRSEAESGIPRARQPHARE